jgi:hypothetical protein
MQSNNSQTFYLGLVLLLLGTAGVYTGQVELFSSVSVIVSLCWNYVTSHYWIVKAVETKPTETKTESTEQ